MANREIRSEEYSEYADSVGECPHYDNQNSHASKFDIFTKIFKMKKRRSKIKSVRSPQVRRVQNIKRVSPQRQGEKIVMVAENGLVYYRPRGEVEELTDITDSVQEPPPYVVFINDTSQVDKQIGDYYEQETKYQEGNKESYEKAQVLDGIRRNKTYFEVVKVQDRGTSPCDRRTVDNKATNTSLPVQCQTFEDKATNTSLPVHCEASCEKEKEELNQELQEMGKKIKSSLKEGTLLLEDIEKIKRHLSSIEKIPEVMSAHMNHKMETPKDFLHVSRVCLMEFGKFILAAQKQMDSDIQKLKSELNVMKKEKSEKEGMIKSLERKLEAQTLKEKQESQDTVQLQSKVGKLQESLEAGKKLLKDTEKCYRVKVDKVESELAAQKQTNLQLSQNIEDKARIINQLEIKIDKLHSSLELSKQQAKDLQSAYKSKIAKLEGEHAIKITSLCENQTTANRQLGQALDQSANYANQLQEVKKDNIALQATNKTLQEKMSTVERDLGKALDKCSVAERKLSRETQEVLSLRSQVERLETLKEEELLSVDGDVWCQIMYQQDQWILDDLRASLQEKEANLETLRGQGDCVLRDFEKVQSELQQRRQQFNELKDVFLDFEKKRDLVVREQRDFYNKMILLSQRTIPRDRFFKNLIEECQLKSEKIEELEVTVKNKDKLVEEARTNSEAQLRAMQAELKFTVEKLYEFENQIRLKDMHLQEVIKVSELEKKNKTTAEEAVNTYKILLEDAKKENADLRSKLNYLEDFEKNRSTGIRASEELTMETEKRKVTESKLKSLEKDFQEMKNQLKSCDYKKTKPPVDVPAGSGKEVEHLQAKVKSLSEDKKYLERILQENLRSREVLQKDQDELYNKLRHAVKVMVESRDAQEAMEEKLDQRMKTIQFLEKSQADTEDRLDTLKDVLHEMKKTVNLLDQEREELRGKLSNHMHCKAERAVHQELKLLQRDKAISEEQNAREREMLFHRLKDNEETMKEQHTHLRAFQDQLDSLNSQLRETKGLAAAERHNHTQQLLTLQADKKKIELYIQELEGRLAYETRLRMQTPDTTTDSPKYFHSSDSHEAPNREKHYYYRK